MIEIKRKDGELIHSTPINEGSVRRFTLMKEDYVLLKFSVLEPLYFKLGDGIDNELGMFEMVDLYTPTYNESTGGYDYELRLDAYYWKWKNKKFKYTPENAGQEASWNMTADLLTHMGVFIRNLKALGYKYRDSDFEVSIDDTVETSAKLLTYDNVNLVDALNMMAEAWDCEWWVTDNIIHFGRCEYDTDIKFEIGVEVAQMPRDNNRSTFATRVYVFGSERNIPANYRPADESVVLNGVVQKRLMLPEGTPYLDAYEGMSQEEAVEDIVIFDDVYPRRVGMIENLTTKEYTDKVENEDGSETQEKWNAYRFKDSGITFSKEYVLEGQELKVIFQSGKLNGLEFGVIFNPHADDEVEQPEKLPDGSWNPAAQLWEIVRNEDYGRPLPDDTIKPENGDKYVLIGFDTKFVSDTMIPEAQEELKAKGQKYLDKTKIDPSTFNCTLFSDYVREDELSRTYEVGDKVTLVNKNYFETNRVSRIIGYERKLDIPYDNPVYFVGEVAAISRLGEVEDKVDELTYKGQTFTGNGSGVYVIGLNDKTNPTNRNVYSALRVLREFVRYEGWINQPVRTIDDVQFNSVKSSKGNWSIDEFGNIIARLVTLTQGLQTDNFAAGLTGTGFGVVNKSEAHMDKAVVRKYLEVLSLVVAQMFYRGGRQVLSPAGMKVSGVEETEDGWRLRMETDEGQRNEFTAGAQARCDRYGTGQRYWWRLVTAVGTDYIEVSKTDRDEGSMAPEVGDEVVQFGHRTDPYLQWVVMDSSFSDDAGRTVYAGVDSYSLDGKMVLREGVDPKDGGRIGLFLADGTEVSTAIGNLQDEIGGLGEGLRMDIAAEEGNLVVDGAYDGDLVATVWRRWNDITSTVSGWVWTRQSGTDSASLASDALWNEAHAGVKSGRIRITGADIVTDTVKFVCDATVGGQTVRGIFNGQ